ncbi:TPA: lipopolysaccharide core heptosyltransferase RfaQ [Citrobacter freundii]
MLKKNPKILIIKLKFQGDVLLTTPVISTLKKHYPDSNIDILVYNSTKQMICENDQLNNIYGMEDRKSSLLKKIINSYVLVKKFRNNNYDIIINLSSQIILGLFLRMIPAGLKIGFNYGRNSSRYWVNSYNKTLDDAGEHIVEQNLSILKLLGINDVIPYTSMPYKKLHWTNLSRKMKELGITDRYVIIQPTARQEFKCWDEEKFSQVIDHLIDKGLDVILTSGPGKEDKAIISKIETHCKHHPVTYFAGKTSFPELAALIDHAQLFIGVDSAPGHIAAAVDTPVVSLFGATKYKFWHPWTDKLELIWAGNYQAMPNRKSLNRNVRYMSCIPAEDVISAADRALKNYPCHKA